MAKLRIGSSLCPNVLSTVVILIFLTALGESQIEFGPDDPVNNEVIYIGEDVILRCEVRGASPDESVQFTILRGDKALIANNSNLSAGNITVIEFNQSYIRFVLKSYATENGEYNCTAISGRKGYGRKIYILKLQQQDTLHCRRNVSGIYISMEFVQLSCYFTPSENKIVKWFKNDTNGVMELNSEKVVINDFKNKLVSVIQPSDELNLSDYFCEENQVDSMDTMTKPTKKCDAGSFLVYNDAFVFFTPKISSISVGSSINLTCDVINLPQNMGSVPIWNGRSEGSLPVGVDISIFDSHVLRIQVSSDAEVGAVIPVTCNVFIGAMVFSTDFTIVVERHEPTHPLTQIPNDDVTSSKNETKQDNNNADNNIFTILVVVSSVAIVIVTSIILPTCFCFCQRKEVSESVNEDINSRNTVINNDGSLFLYAKNIPLQNGTEYERQIGTSYTDEHKYYECDFDGVSNDPSGELK